MTDLSLFDLWKKYHIVPHCRFRLIYRKLKVPHCNKETELSLYDLWTHTTLYHIVDIGLFTGCAICFRHFGLAVQTQPPGDACANFIQDSNY